MDGDDHQDPTAPGSTKDKGYAQRLAGLEARGIRRLVDVQAPYRWNIRRLGLGFVLDVGCGLGRNLEHLDRNGVGVDHNEHSVAIARDRGCTAFTPEYAVPDRFDALLTAHVVEHLDWDRAVGLVEQYLRFVRPGGTVVVICPQEAGQRSDTTHVTYFDGERLRRLADACGLRVRSVRSFPFPRVVGRWFTYNETLLVAEIPG
jgi:SAM-dependent methyltransferase